MIKFWFSFLLISLVGHYCIAQHLVWENPIEIKIDNITQVSVDNQGYLFVVNQEGDILQYNHLGEFINNFSPTRQGKVNQLEAAWTVNIFTFSIDLQEYRILDRFLNPIAENRIQQKGINLARAATLGNNNIIWIYDESDFRLNQFDHRRNQILQQQPLNLILTNSTLAIQEIKEYQNLVFIKITDEGVSILDNQANFIKSIPLENGQRLSFWKKNIISLSKNNLVMTDYLTSEKNFYEIPQELEKHQVIISNEAVIFYNNESVKIYNKTLSPLKAI
ncbi:hypothetical protein Belba_3685 [Belliella baltica DSM 15883]|uniref:Uncharacterized protein n=1 Tax=Belliella baltica (strain DSM 15883 / CIP 108006 / LMG 21964 / BA134) TaxID=866536 RepID=I3ZAA7_BELBD|nr:hypothetical protein [Belliella baltica]AFL86175.1 hypothetical protein Belba_3685 [Belliella baltica DSM 15883]